MNLPDQIFYLQSLDESLVIGFEYDSDSKQIEFVYDYAAEVVSKHFQMQAKQLIGKAPLRDFRRVIFRSVDGLRIKNQEIIGDRLLASLKERIASPGVVVVNSQFVSDDEDTSVRLGLSFGFQISWNYRGMTMEKKLCYAKQVAKDEWQYFDNTTSKEVNFYKPFG